MAESNDKLRSCPGFKEDGGNFRRVADRRTREVKLQDRLAEWLFRMEPEDMNCATLDSLLDELNQVAPLPGYKEFDTEDNLAQLHRKCRAAQHAAPGRPAAHANSYRRSVPMRIPYLPDISHINERQMAKLICGSACLIAATKYVQWYWWI